MADTLLVKYQDAGGNAQNETFTSSVRALSDAGISDQEKVFEGGTLVDNGPDQIAAVFFDLQGQDPPLSGSIDLVGSMRLASGGSQPAYTVRADGSLIRVEDLLPITELYALTDLRQTLLPIKHVEVDCSGDAPRTSLSVDQGSDAMSVLQSRFEQEFAAANL